MLNAVADIGRNQFNKLQEEGGDILDIFVQDVSGRGIYNKGILITLEKKNEEYFYKGIDLREYNEEDKKKYLYRAGSSRGADLTPTAKITEASKTFKNKIIKCLKETVDIQKDEFQEELIELHKIRLMLEENSEQIINDIEKQKKALDKKEQAFLTLLLKINNEEEKFIGDYEVYKYKLIEDTLKKYYFSQTYNVISKAENKICSMCLKQKEVNGLASPFAFTTFDKLGYLSGGFQRENSWKNVPICKDCGIALEIGKNYLNEYLKFSFFEMNYYIIPKSIDGNLNRILKTYERLKRSDKFEDHKEIYITTEERIIRRLGEDVNKVTLNLMFFEENQNAFNILANVDDVLPSRLKFVFDEIRNVNHLNMFKKFRIYKGKEVPVFINFRTLNEVVGSKSYRKYFLECVYKIFKGDKISYSFLLKFMIQDILQAYNKENHDKKDIREREFNLTTISNYGLLYFMKKIGVLNYKRKEGASMLEAGKNTYNLRDYKNKEAMFEDFFNHQLDFFDLPIKKALFLQGYLAQKLINFQAFENDGRTPFKARLKGLKLNKRDIKRLLIEIRAKFDEYDINYYKQEQNLLSRYLIECGQKWDISNLEIPFYFALGMNMVHCFITNDKEDK